MGYARTVSARTCTTYISIDEITRQAEIVTISIRLLARRLFRANLARVAILVTMLNPAWLVGTPPAFANDASSARPEASFGLLDAPATTYLDNLLGEISVRRARAGSPPVVYAGEKANRAVSQYLADLTPRMVAVRSCFHGNGNPVLPGWDYVKGSGFTGQARGEILACPGDNGFWTAPKIADGWWGSLSHWRSLYGDPAANAIACGTFGAQNGGRAYQTIACITFKV